MKVRGADARRFVPGRYARCMGGTKSAASFIDWSGVYTESERETKRRAALKNRIDYVKCMACGANIALHNGRGVTHIAGVALCGTCADAQ